MVVVFAVAMVVSVMSTLPDHHPSLPLSCPLSPRLSPPLPDPLFVGRSSFLRVRQFQFSSEFFLPFPHFTCLVLPRSLDPAKMFTRNTRCLTLTCRVIAVLCFVVSGVVCCMYALPGAFFVLQMYVCVCVGGLPFAVSKLCWGIFYLVSFGVAHSYFFFFFGFLGLCCAIYVSSFITSRVVFRIYNSLCSFPPS